MNFTFKFRPSDINGENEGENKNDEKQRVMMQIAENELFIKSGGLFGAWLLP